MARLRWIEVQEVDLGSQTVAYVRSVSLGDRLRFEELSDKNRDYILETYLAFFLCDEKGNRIFTDDDIPMFSSKNAGVVVAISKAAMHLNGMEADSIDTEKKD